MQENGYVAKLLFAAGSKDIPLGTTIAILVEDKSMIAAFAGDYSSAPSGAAPAQAAPAQVKAEVSSSSAPTSGVTHAATGDRKFISPLAKKLADEKGMNL